MTLVRHGGHIDLEQLLDLTDLPAFAAEIAGPGRSQGRLTVHHCPSLNHPDHHPSFQVGDRFWNCRSQCNVGGTAIDLCVWHFGMSVGDAIRYLIARANLQPEATPRQRQPRPATPRPKATARRPPVDTSTPVVGDEGESVLADFCAERDWRVDTAHLLGLTVVRDQYGRHRVRFPSIVQGRLVYWQDRATWANPVKGERWRAPARGCPAPFGLDRLPLLDAMAAEDEQVWITEGPTDATAIVDAYPGAVVIGLPGGSFQRLGPRMARTLATVPTFVLLDNDPTGVDNRAMLDKALAAHSARPVHVHVAAGFNDAAEWRKTAGDDFAEQLTDATADAFNAQGAGT